MNGKRNIKHSEQMSLRLVMTVVCIIAVLMVTVYCVGAQFRPETDTGMVSDESDSDDHIQFDRDPDFNPETEEERGAFELYISITPENDDGNDDDSDNNDDGDNDNDVGMSFDPFTPLIVMHAHRWVPATCMMPEVCRICGAEGEPAYGHKWLAATCTEPSTCKYCGETTGKAVGHNWSDATCTKPKTCKTCGETKGEALGHKWKSATCTEPQKCSRCGKTSGSAAGHKWKDATTTSPKKCTACGTTSGDRLPKSGKVKAWSYTDEDLEILASIICYEARNASVDGKRAVGTVIMNRVRSSKFPNTIKDVVLAPGQFGSNMTLEKLLSENPNSECYAAAKWCLEGNLYDVDILYFKSSKLTKSWGVRKYCFTCGGHYFYT